MMQTTMQRKKMFRLLVIVLASLVAISALFAVLGWNHTDTALAVYSSTKSSNGTNDFNNSSNVAGNETFATSTAGITSYVSWDSTKLYLGYSAADVHWNTSNNLEKWVMWYIGVPGAANSTTTSQLYRTQQAGLPFAATYLIRFRPETSDNGISNIQTWNGSSWNNTKSFVWNTEMHRDTSASPAFLKLTLNRSDLGLTNAKTFRIVSFILRETNGQERMWGAMPSDSFADGYDMNPATFYEFDLDDPGATASSAQWNNYNFTPTSRTGTSVTFSFLNPSRTTAASAVKIQRSTNNGTTWTDATVSTGGTSIATNATSATVVGLSPSTAYKFRLVVTGGTHQGSSTIANQTTNANTAPTNITLSNSSIAEMSGADATVGTLSVTDPDIGDAITYSLVTGTGSTDNGIFNISGTTLRASSDLDFESKSSYSVRVRAADSNGGTTESALTITATNINEAPSNISLSSATVAENAATNAIIGTLSATDQDAGASFTFSLPSGSDNSSFNISGTNLRTSVSFDFETKSSYTVNVRVTDQGGLTFDKNFTISVTNVNEAPVTTAGTLSVTEDTTATGTLTGFDVDSAGLTYSVVTQGSKGTVTITDASTGAYSYAPNANANGSDSFTFKINDGGLDSNTATITVTISSVNDAPTLTSVNAFTGTEDTSLTISYTDLATAANEADVDGDTISFRIAAVSTGTLTKNGTPVTAGTTTLATGESLVWTPAANANGTLNAFTIVALDGTTASSPAVQVQVNVTAVNDNPTISSVSNQTINEDGATADLNITVGDVETAAGSLTLSGSSSNTTLVPDNAANITFGGSGASRTVKITPVANLSGTANITIFVNDGSGGSASITFTVTVNSVNDTPTSLTLSANTLAENAGANFEIGTLAATDSADAGETFTYTLVSGTDSDQNANFNISGNKLRATGSLDFESLSSHKIRVRATDSGGATFEQTFTITVTNVAETVTVTFDAQSGSITGGNTQIKLVGSTYGKASDGSTNAPLPTPTYTGYVFAGWYTQAGGAGTMINGSSTVSIQTDHTLYAHWTANTFTVTYFANGSTSGTAPTAVTQNFGSTVTVASQGSLLRTGYTFSGWNTTANGSGTARAAGSTFTLDAANVSLHAQWSANTYTVTFDAEGGSVDPATQSKRFDSAYNVSAVDGSSQPLPTPTRTGHTFDGWWTEDNGTGNQVTNATIVSAVAHHTLYAKWNVNTYIVDFNTNSGGAVNAPASQTKLFNSQYGKGANGSTDVPLPVLTRTGYTFNGWNTAADGSGASITDSTTVTNASNHTLYARWTLQTRTVTFNTNEGTAVAAVQTNWNTAIAAPTAPTKNGFTFASWHTDAGLTSAAFNFNTLITEDITLYAKWIQNGYTVTFVTNGGNPISNIGVVHGEALTAPATPQRTGYTFGNWFSNIGLSTLYNFSTPVTGPITLYASWTINNYDITYNGNGNTGGTVPAALNNQDFESVITVSANTGNLVRNGFTFSGWNTAANGSGTDRGEGSSFTLGAGDVELFAKWTNTAPSAITLSSLNIQENSSANAVVGNLGATDAETGSTFSFELVAGQGADDNVSFNINGSQLRATGSFNFEAKASYKIRLRVTDNGGLTFDQAFTISVTNQNEAPTLTSITTLGSASEDTARTITYAQLIAAANESDVDANDVLVFKVMAVSSGTLTKGGLAVQAGVTTIGENESLVWTPAANANGTLPAFTVVVRDQDGLGLDSALPAVQVSVEVAAVNDAPTLTTVNTSGWVNGTEDTAYTITYAQLLAASNEADVDSGTINFMVSGVLSGTLTKNGLSVVPGVTTISSGESIVWTPAANTTGTIAGFSVRAFDGDLSSATAVQVSINVDSVNDNPIISEIADQLTSQNTALNGISFTASDVETAVLSVSNFSYTSSNTNLIGEGDITFSIIGSNVTMNINPNLNRSGKTTITITVSDASSPAGTIQETFELTVRPAAVTQLTTSDKSTITGAESFTVVWQTANQDVKYYKVFLNDVLVSSQQNPGIAKSMFFNGTVGGIPIESGADKSYNVKVVIVDNHDVESVATETTIDMSDATKPAWTTNTGITVVNRTLSSLTIRWPQANDTSKIGAYKIVLTVGGVELSPITKTLTEEEQNLAAGSSITQTISGLTPNTTYDIKIIAIDTKNNSSDPLPPSPEPTAEQVAASFRELKNVKTAMDVELPSKPTGLDDVNLTSTSVTIEWQASTDNDGIAGYNVYVQLRQQSVALLYRSVQLAGNTLDGIVSTTITGLIPGREYKITVRAIDRVGNLSSMPTESDELVVTTLTDSTAPSINSGVLVEASNQTETSIQINWAGVFSDNIDSQGELRYRVFINGVAVSLPSSPYRSTQFVITGLRQDTSYIITVRAYDKNDNESAAATVTATTLKDSTPPTAFTVTAGSIVVNAQSISTTITWTESTDPNLTKYEVYLKQPGEGSEFEKIATLNIPLANRSFVISGLRPGQTGYIVKVIAIDSAGNPTESNEVTFNTPVETTPPTAPAILTVSRVVENDVVLTDRFNLSWPAATDNDGIEGYEVYYILPGASSATNWSKLTDPPLSAGTRTLLITKAMIDSLDAPAGVHFKVVAIDKSGNKSANAAETPKTGLLVKLTDTVKPNAPNLGTLTPQATDTTVTLRWRQATDVNNTSSIYRFNVYRGEEAVGSVLVNPAVTGSSTATHSFTVTGLNIDTAYTFFISAVDASGNESVKSAAINATTTGDKTPPTAPAQIGLPIITHNTLTYQFSDSSDNITATEELTYEYRMNASSNALTVMERPLRITNLIPGTPFNAIQIRAKDAAGNVSAWVTLTPATTLNDTAPPSAPTLSATAFRTSILLTWTPSNDNFEVKSYKLYRVSGKTVTLIESLGANVTSYEVTGLTESTSYTFRVRAEDTKGNLSPIGNTSSVTLPTLPILELTPIQITASAIDTTEGQDGSRTTISWTRPDKLAIAGYRVFLNGIEQSGMVPGTATSYVIDKLQPSTLYKVAVRYFVTGSQTPSPFSNVEIFTTAADTVNPSAPTARIADAVTATGGKIRWNAASDNVAISHYEVYQVVNGEDVAMNPLTTQELEYVVSGLTKSTANIFKIIAVDTSNRKSVPLSITLTTIADKIAPSVPTNPNDITITNEARTGAQITLQINWPASTDNTFEENEPFKYNVFIDGKMVSPREGITTTSFTTATPLAINRKYRIQIQAIDSDGNVSGLSVAKEHTTLVDDTKPYTPTDVSFTQLTPVRVVVSWDVGVEGELIGDDVGVTQYRIFINDQLIGTAAANRTSAVVSVPPAGTPDLANPRIIVRAVDAAGNLSDVGEVSGAGYIPYTLREDSQNPEAPLGILVTYPGQGLVRIQWNAAFDNDRIAKYEVRGLGATVTINAPATFHEFTPLTNDPFTVEVVAFDRSDNQSENNMKVYVIPPSQTANLASGSTGINSVSFTNMITKTRPTIRYSTGIETKMTLTYFRDVNGDGINNDGAGDTAVTPINVMNNVTVPRGSKAISFPNLGNGTYVIRYLITDSAGEQARLYMAVLVVDKNASNFQTIDVNTGDKPSNNNITEYFDGNIQDPAMATENQKKSKATIWYRLAEHKVSTIVITNSKRATIRNILINERLPRNDHFFEWNGVDNKGNFVPDGVYTVTFTGSDLTANRARELKTNITIERNNPTVTIVNNRLRPGTNYTINYTLDEAATITNAQLCSGTEPTVAESGVVTGCTAVTGATISGATGTKKEGANRFTIRLTSQLAEGTYFLVIVARDNAMKLNTDKVLELFIDNTRPVVSEITASDITGTGSSDIQYKVSEAARVTVTVRQGETATGTVIRTFTTTVTSGFDQFKTISWNGRDSRNRNAANGKYYIQISATDSAGNPFAASETNTGFVVINKGPAS